jgi:hypothetical protein
MMKPGLSNVWDMRRTGLIRILSVTTQQALKAPKVQLNDETRFVRINAKLTGAKGWRER